MLLQLRVRAASLHHHLALSQHLDPRPAGAADGARPGRAPATSGRAYCSSAAAAARGIAADAAGGGAMCATPEKMAAARAAAAGRPAVVCYHHPCNDGVYAALAAHAHFARGGGSNSNARFWPLNVFKPPVISEMGLRGDEVVYMLDYTGPKGFARELAGHCARWACVGACLRVCFGGRHARVCRVCSRASSMFVQLCLYGGLSPAGD